MCHGGVKTCFATLRKNVFSLTNILSMDKLNSTVNRYLSSSTSSDESVRLPEEEKSGKNRKIAPALTMPFSKLSEWQKVWHRKWTLS